MDHRAGGRWADWNWEFGLWDFEFGIASRLGSVVSVDS